MTESILLSDLIDKYNSDRIARKGGNWKVPSVEKTKFRRLVDILGDLRLGEINREMGKEVRGVIMRLPKNSAKCRNKTPSEILQVKHEETLSVKTVRDHIVLYAQLFKWARREELYTHQNPFSDVAPIDNRPANECRNDFTDDELITIFSGDAFCRFQTKTHRPHHYWAPLIALHTGMRNAEIGAIEVDDFHKVKNPDTGEDIWYFNIHNHDGTTSLKTRNATRQTPIHPKLLELGIIEYRDSIKAQGNERVFPYLNWDSTDGYGRYIGEHFIAYLKKLKIHVPLKKVFYSFRHTIQTKLERAEVPDARIALISGHASSARKTTGRSTYITPANAGVLYNDLTKINFDFALHPVVQFHEMID
jgi:integrase